MRAYAEEYLPDAMRTLGGAFDCAVHRAGLGLQQFFDLFVATGVAGQFGLGNPRYVAGMTGPELVLATCAKAGLDVGIAVVEHAPLQETEEYWAGWALAYYQWATGRTFRSIAGICPMDDVTAMYHPLHEAPEDKFVEVMERRAAQAPTQLATIRKARGLSQAGLAEQSGVSLRAIQQYEQRVKDIDKAQLATAHRLARTLGCTTDDLLEYPLP